MPSHKGGECATGAQRREDGGNAVPRAHTALPLARTLASARVFFEKSGCAVKVLLWPLAVVARGFVFPSPKGTIMG